MLWTGLVEGLSSIKSALKLQRTRLNEPTLKKLSQAIYGATGSGTVKPARQRFYLSVITTFFIFAKNVSTLGDGVQSCLAWILLNFSSFRGK
jgi:hypothetical protein